MARPETGLHLISLVAPTRRAGGPHGAAGPGDGPAGDAGG